MTVYNDRRVPQQAAASVFAPSPHPFYLSHTLRPPWHYKSTTALQCRTHRYIVWDHHRGIWHTNAINSLALSWNTSRVRARHIPSPILFVHPFSWTSPGVLESWSRSARTHIRTSIVYAQPIIVIHSRYNLRVLRNAKCVPIRMASMSPRFVVDSRAQTWSPPPTVLLWRVLRGIWEG